MQSSKIVLSPRWWQVWTSKSETIFPKWRCNRHKGAISKTLICIAIYKWLHYQKMQTRLCYLDILATEWKFNSKNVDVKPRSEYLLMWKHSKYRIHQGITRRQIRAFEMRKRLRIRFVTEHTISSEIILLPQAISLIHCQNKLRISQRVTLLYS